MERRKSERRQIKGKVSFQWKLGRHTCFHERARLRDISRTGLFVEADNAPAVGTVLSLQCQVVGAHDVPIVLIRTTGRIRRVERQPETGYSLGFAVHMTKAQLQKLESDSSEHILFSEPVL